MAYCPRCGSELQPQAAFCSKCGAPTSTATATATAAAAAAPQYGYEKQEKREKREKEVRQGEKYEKHERGGDRSGPLIGGAILILLGAIFFVNLTDPLLLPSRQIWAVFLFGVGLILIAQALYRYVAMKQRGVATGTMYGGVILMAIGGGSIIGGGNIWPFVLIALGAIIILVTLTARRQAPRP